MWNKLLGLNTFIIWPVISVFFIYSIGQLLLHGDWQSFLAGAVLFGLAVLAEVVLGILS